MFKVRHPNNNDIPALLEIEFDRYSTLYSEMPDKKNEVRSRFEKRLSIAREWTWVLEQNGEVVGFITGQPTSSEPSEFKSWEESTNNGTLEGKFFPEGKNVYVVNLDVKRSATKHNGQYLLMAYLGAAAVRQGKEKVVFESRMPGFRDWIYNSENISPNEWNNMSAENKLRKAEVYVSLTTIVNGKEVLHDRLLRFYEGSGFTFVKVYPNAFEDVESLNFGVLCVGFNPVPTRLRLKPINHVVAWLFEILGKNQRMLERFVG